MLGKIIEETKKLWEQHCQEEIQKIDATAMSYHLLASEDFSPAFHLPKFRWDFLYPRFRVTDMKDFVKVHKALGKLQQAGIEPITDGRSNVVDVVLRPVDQQFHHLRFTYQKKLGKFSKKCKIVTRTTKERVMVCE